MDIFSWLASLGTPKLSNRVRAEPVITRTSDMYFNIKTKPFEFTEDELRIREDWLGELNTGAYLFKVMQQLPQHFQIGSVIFLWGTVSKNDHVQYMGHSVIDRITTLEIISYIQDKPEYDNGSCGIYRVDYSLYSYGEGSKHYSKYKIDNSDLFMYIMDNLDKVKDCTNQQLRHL